MKTDDDHVALPAVEAVAATVTDKRHRIDNNNNSPSKPDPKRSRKEAIDLTRPAFNIEAAKCKKSQGTCCKCTLKPKGRCQGSCLCRKAKRQCRTNCKCGEHCQNQNLHCKETNDEKSKPKSDERLTNSGSSTSPSTSLEDTPTPTRTGSPRTNASINETNGRASASSNSDDNNNLTQEETEVELNGQSQPSPTQQNEEETSESADPPDDTWEDKISSKFDGEIIHQNDGTHLSGGIADDAIWQGWWRRLLVLPAKYYKIHVSKETKRLDELLEQILKDVMARKCNSEKFLVFLSVILHRNPEVKSARDIRKRIGTRLDAWERGEFKMLVQTAEADMKAFLTQSHPKPRTTQ